MHSGYKPLALLLFLTLLAATGCGKQVLLEGPPGLQTPTPPGRAVLATARSVLGTPYLYGGASPKTGFDCSGLTNWVYARHGIRLPRTARDQFESGRPVPWGGLAPADLVFFRTSFLGKSLHVGIYSGKGMFIHSPKSGGLAREENMCSSYWRSRFLGGRRLLE